LELIESRIPEFAVLPDGVTVDGILQDRLNVSERKRHFVSHSFVHILLRLKDRWARRRSSMPGRTKSEESNSSRKEAMSAASKIINAEVCQETCPCSEPGHGAACAMPCRAMI